MLTLELLRHGALEGGVKYRGQVNDPLTIEGRKSMDRVWNQVSEDIDFIISSPLDRCAEPAKIWAQETGVECLIEPRLAEIHYGEWEGKTIPEIRQQYPGILERWRDNPEGMRPPSGESPEELRARLADWWSETSVQFRHRHLLIVAHSGSLRMLIALLLDKPIAYTRTLDMPYACWSRIQCDGRNNSLVFHAR